MGLRIVNVKPGAVYEATFAAGTSGLEGTLALALLDNQGVVTEDFSTSDIAELVVDATPTGVYVATRTAPDDGGQYTLLWSLDGTADPDETFTDELVVTFSAPSGDAEGSAYATVDELARILKIRTPSAEQTAAMNRVLITAAGEIDSEVDLADDVDLSGWQLSLAAEVNLERAVEHWQQMESPFGILGLDGALGPTHTATDSWNRHANKLAPLKGQFGLA